MDIRKKRERKTMLIGEPLMTRYVVGTYAEYFYSKTLELRKIVADGAGLCGALGRIVPWVEIKKNPMSPIVPEGVVFAGLIRESKIRRDGSCARLLIVHCLIVSLPQKILA